MSSGNGLQAERTTMAWQRTALGLGAVSALLLHHARGDLVRSIPGVVGMLAALGVLVLVESRHARGVGGAPEEAPVGAAAVRSLAVVAVLVSLGAALVVVPGR